MQYTRFIILNGPPRSGKSTIVREMSSYMRDKGVSCISDSFAAPMKHFIATALGERYDTFNKESPRAELQGYSIREFLIDLSESYIKERYDRGVFGRWLYHRVGRLNPAPSFVLCDDCGFEEEFEALTGGNRKRAILVRIERPNTSFEDDSRKYLDIQPDYTIKNETDVVDVWLQARHLADLIIANRV